MEKEFINKASNVFMKEAINEALSGILNKHGGPFGSVIVKDNKIIGRGHNKVLLDHDPTCHGEVSAIRDACKNINSHDLKGCIIYTTGEPCPMCLFACLWANIDKIYYGCTIEDNSIIGFRDEEFTNLVGNKDKLENYQECLDRESCLELFKYYNLLEHDLY